MYICIVSMTMILWHIIQTVRNLYVSYSMDIHDYGYLQMCLMKIVTFGDNIKSVGSIIKRSGNIVTFGDNINKFCW